MDSENILTNDESAATEKPTTELKCLSPFLGVGCCSVLTVFAHCAPGLHSNQCHRTTRSSKGYCHFSCTIGQASVLRYTARELVKHVLTSSTLPIFRNHAVFPECPPLAEAVPSVDSRECGKGREHIDPRGPSPAS